MPNALAFSVESSVFYPSGRVPKIEHGSSLLDYEFRHRAFDVSVSPAEAVGERR
jgi:hypothetical protein